MTRPEIDRLLALYSSGQITDDERDALFTAALEDQVLFEELFEEDELRTAFEDPAVRRAALALPVAPPEMRRSFWRTPWPAAFAALAACAVLAVVIVRRPAPEPQPQLTVANRPAPAVEEQKAKITELATKDQAPASVLRDRSQPVPPPPPPAAVAARTENDENELRAAAGQSQEKAESAVADAVVVAAAPAPAPARSKAVAAEAVAVQTMAFREAASPVTAILQVRDAEGQWRPVTPGASISRDTPLRVTVESTVAGRIAIRPAFTPPAPIQPGKALTFHLPVQEPGDRTLEISLVPGEPAAGKPSALGATSTLRQRDNTVVQAPAAPSGLPAAVIRFRID